MDIFRKLRGEECEECKSSAGTVKRNADGTFSNAFPKRLADERDSILSILRHMPVMNEKECEDFQSGADYNKGKLQETGTIEQTTDWAIGKAVEFAKLIRRNLPEVKDVHVECNFSHQGRHIMTITLYRTFSRVPHGFDWMALHGPGIDTVPAIYIARKSENFCQVWYVGRNKLLGP